MDDERVWGFEHSLWVCEPEHYRELVDPEVVMVVPQEPFVLQGEAAIRAVQNTPRWAEAEITQGVISRPQEGLIAIAYHVTAKHGDDTENDYEAWCTSVYRRLEHDVWRVIQHQQTPPLAVGVPASGT